MRIDSFVFGSDLFHFPKSWFARFVLPMLVCILHSTLSFADTEGSTPGSVWSLAGRALYLHPSYGGDGLGYSTYSNYGTDTFGNVVEQNGALNQMHNVAPNWGWGYQLEGTYLVKPRHDVDVNWYHFSRQTAATLPHNTIYSGSAAGLYGGNISVNLSWDAVNVEVGQSIRIDQQSDLHVHVGVEYARIVSQIMNGPLLLPSATAVALFITEDDITYNGFGPHFGADFDYTVGYGLSLYAKGAGSLLVGTSGQTVQGYNDLASTNTPYSSGNYSQRNSGIVVPEVEAKLGFTYAYTTLSTGCFKFDVGYMWLSYLNAIISQVGVGVAGSSIGTSTAANFDVNGLYFGLQWVGQA